RLDLDGHGGPRRQRVLRHRLLVERDSKPSEGAVPVLAEPAEKEGGHKSDEDDDKSAGDPIPEMRVLLAERCVVTNGCVDLHVRDRQAIDAVPVHAPPCATWCSSRPVSSATDVVHKAHGGMVAQARPVRGRYRSRGSCVIDRYSPV